MGSLLLAAGAKGKRFCLPNSRIMIHQPSGGAQGQATDIEIQAREILALRSRLNEIYADHTGQSVDVISEAVERDKFMTPEAAKEFGLIDEVVASRAVKEGDSDGDSDGGDGGGYSQPLERNASNLADWSTEVGAGTGRLGRRGSRALDR